MATANPSLMSAELTVPQGICAVFYTDSWRPGVPGVPFYETGADSTTIHFENTNSFAGGDISSIDGTVFELTGDLVYALTANVKCNVPGATVQWYEVGNGPIAQSAPCGSSFTTYWHPADPASIVLNVYAPTGETFSYPASVLGATAAIQVVDGFEVV